MGKIESKIIYVLCPANNKTGGTELLHQLVDELNNLNKKAYIVYYFEGKYDKNNPTPVEFLKYNLKICKLNNIIDNKDNVLIIPEVCLGKHKKFKKIKKAVWWLSVDNFKIMSGYKNRLKRFGFKSFLKHIALNDFFTTKDLLKIDYHLYQSYFAKSFLNKQKIDSGKMFYLSDYINDIYNSDYNINEKENIIIYNPKKGFEFTKKIINYNKTLKWIPIQNMTNMEVQKLMKRAKIYVDFGNHPGKDRIPREAAMSGCCVFTNRKGSAGFSEDVPILDKYKFDDIDSNIEMIVKNLNECLDNYNSNINDFKDYRDFIKNEKNVFKNDVKSIFL